MNYHITGKIGNLDVNLLAVPEDAPPPPPPPGPGPDVVVFERPGIFHEATAENPQLQINDGITPPPGVYSEARIEFDFYFSGLNPAAPTGRHNVCWFALDGNGAMLFYPLVVRDVFRVGHGVSEEAGTPKHRIERPFPGVQGWYLVRGVYGHSWVTCNLTPPSIEFTDQADVDRLVVKPGSQFRVHFGFHGKAGPEFPPPEKEPISLGWRWRNLRISYRPEVP